MLLYSPRSVKPFMDFQSSPSKQVKNSITPHHVYNMLCASRSCTKCQNQLNRLWLSNFPEGTLSSLSRSLFNNSNRKGVDKRVTSEENTPIICTSYLPAFFHHMKKAGNFFGVKVVFSSWVRLSRVCAGKLR